MAGIYNRDNYAQLMQNALNNAYNRRAATQRERAERVKEIVNAGGDLAKVLGRTAEEWDVPDQYKDNPDYRAARFDYILGGDRSGLDAFRQAEMQAEQARRQQEFTAAENALNRKMQMAENEKNREIQRQQHGLEKMTEKARLLRDYRDAVAILQDMEGDNKSKYNDVDRAKAKNNLDLTRDLLKNSGQFTNAELEKAGIVEEEKKPVSIVPFKPGYTPEAAPAPQAPVPVAPVETPVDNSWNKFYARNVEIKGADDKKLDELEAKFGEYKKDEANADEYEKFKKSIADQRKTNENTRAAQRKAAAKNETARQFVQGGGLSKTQVRNALGMAGKGGGKTEATIPGTWTYNGKEENVVYTVKRDGLTAYISVDGKPVGEIGLGY